MTGFQSLVVTKPIPNFEIAGAGEVDDLVDDPADQRDGERCREAGEASQQRVADAVPGAVAPGPGTGLLRAPAST